MTIHEVKKLVIDPGGFAELQVDRVRGDLRRKISRKKVANSALVDGLRKNNVYPAGCKFVATQGKMTAYVIEQMPQVRNVQWDFFSQGSWKKVVQEGCLRKFGLTNADTNRNRFSLAFPFIVFVVLFNGPQICNFFVFFRNEPLRSLNDHLLRPCITNQHDTYAMCIDIVPSRQGMTKAMLAEEQIDVFWNSSFNKDLPTHFLSYSSTTELKSIWHWEYWSRVDPFWPLRKNWSRCKHVLGTRIEYMFSRWIKLEEGRSVFQIFEKQV